MTWLRLLDDLDLADLPTVGPKAYYLSLLKQGGLPVAQGWVLTAHAWHHSLGKMSWPQPEQDCLAPLNQGGFEALRRRSQQWQQALRDMPAIAPTFLISRMMSSIRLCNIGSPPLIVMRVAPKRPRWRTRSSMMSIGTSFEKSSYSLQ